MTLVPFYGLLILGVWGILKILLGVWSVINIFGDSKYRFIYKVLIFILVFVPIINLILLIWLNYIVNNKLKALGFKIGLMGVKTTNNPV